MLQLYPNGTNPEIHTAFNAAINTYMTEHMTNSKLPSNIIYGESGKQLIDNFLYVTSSK